MRTNGQPVDQLNELECVGPHVYANIWMTDRIVRIDPKSGEVTQLIDASNLLPPAERYGTDVLNGIAHDPKDDTFLITGKLWPRMFRVQVRSVRGLGGQGLGDQGKRLSKERPGGSPHRAVVVESQSSVRQRG